MACLDRKSEKWCASCKKQSMFLNGKEQKEIPPCYMGQVGNLPELMAVCPSSSSVCELHHNRMTFYYRRKCFYEQGYSGLEEFASRAPNNLPHFPGGLIPDLLTSSSNVDIGDQGRLLTFKSAQKTTKNGGEIWQSRVWYPMS